VKEGCVMTFCKDCKAKIIWMKTRGESKILVDWTQKIVGDTVFEPKRHVPHFTTCPEHETFKERKTKKIL